MKEFIDEKIYFTGRDQTMCKTFGCGRTLTLREQLFGDTCVKCTGPPETKEFDLREILQTNKIKAVIEGLEAGIIAMSFECSGLKDERVIQAMRIKIDRLLGKLNNKRLM